MATPDSNAPPPRRLPTLILLFFTTVGVPTAAGLGFAEKVTQNPWLTFALFLLYEVTIAVLGFATKVWQKLEPQWVERSAQWLDAKLQAPFPRYRKRYLQHLIYRHRDFDVKGLSTQGVHTLELARVFVELSVDPQPIQKIATDPIRQLPELLREGQHTIWDYLRSTPLTDQHLAIIGAPGSGKTTLLKHLVLVLASGKRSPGQHGLRHTFPVLLFLRAHASAIIANPAIPLAQVIADTLSKEMDSAPPPAAWFAKQLAKKRCLIMCDGLDEVADPETRKKVGAWVEQQMTTHGGNRFLVTSRPFGYRSNPLSGVTVLEVRPFASDQVQRFVHNWYQADETMSAGKDDPGVRMKAREGAEDLLQRLRNAPALADLAVNPLLLTMIATVHRHRSSLPGRRVELYAEIYEVFLGKRQQARGLELDLTPSQKQIVLQPLAYRLMEQGRREVPLTEAQTIIAPALALVSPQTSGKDFLRMVENSSGLLIERENGVYSFAHLTFQEYLAAMHAKEQQMEKTLVARVGQSWWHETLRLYAAQADATAIVTACLADERPSVPALTLAIECVDEAQRVDPAQRARLETILTQWVEDPDSERRRIVAEVRLALHLRRMVRIDEDTYRSDVLVAHGEYQLFLDEQRTKGAYYQPDHWREHQFPAGQGHAPVVGVRPSDATAFCHWLAQRERGEWQYRLPRSGEFSPTTVLSEKTLTVGYWTTSAEQRVYEGVSSGIPALTWQMLEQWIEKDHAHALDLFRARDLALDRTRDRALALAFALDFARARDRARDFTLDFARALARDRDFTRALARDRARIGVLAVAARLAYAAQAPSFRSLLPWVKRLLFWRSPDLTSRREKWQSLANDWLDAYASLVILEERSQGNLPAFEGIRLVKERKRAAGV
ncbi:MAG: NACHT domain-containing protein [Deltaproteobacteria bacterium]|nr:NACHT domain-containing protein [Deltaproteobacteria bacterium]